MIQPKLFEDKVEFIHVESVIGSGYEELVADLAIRDKVAYRAARKNMQIHSAIIIKINDGIIIVERITSIFSIRWFISSILKNMK